ncbi:DUF3742 family protein [Paucibacter sp. O1-1]|nr:DUF3742 family protein [Paucibacter sp. O1-1]MDA3831672.1 DUF3742 family protein [Paucibacter sp. O1-1]
MKTAAQTTFPERLGRALGRLWRGCVRMDRRAMQALVAKGWKPGVAKGVMLLVKIAAFGVLLYAAFWMALLLLCIVVVASFLASLVIRRLRTFVTVGSIRLLSASDRLGAMWRAVLRCRKRDFRPGHSGKSKPPAIFCAGSRDQAETHPASPGDE